MIDYEDLREFANLIEGRKFVFAKTMPETPHWYTLRKDWVAHEFDAAVRMIGELGYRQKWGRTTYSYINLNGFRYWAMKGDQLINRAEVDYDSVFDEVADLYDLRFSDPQSVAEDGEVIHMIGELDGRVLDVGAGTGLLLDRVAIGPDRYVGIDPSRGMAAQFHAKHPEHTLVHCPLEDYANGTFDHIVALYGTASYFPYEALPRLRSMLTPGGRMFLMFYEPDYEPVSCVGASRPSGHLDRGWEHLWGATIEKYHHYVIARATQTLSAP